MSKEREPASGAAEGARRATGGAPEEGRDRRDAVRLAGAVPGGRRSKPESAGSRCGQRKDAAAEIAGCRSEHEQRTAARKNPPPGGRTPFGLAEAEAMSRAASPFTGRRYRLVRRGVAREDPRAAGGLAVLRRGPSQSVGATALRASAHVEGAGAAADARSAVAGAVPHVSEGRESAHRHDHHGAA